MLSRTANINMKIDRHNPHVHTAFYVSLAFFVILGVIFPVFSVIAFGLMAIYVIMACPKNVFLCLFFMMPFASVFKTAPSATSLFTYIVLLVVIRLFFSRKKISSTFLLLWILLFVYLFFGANGQYTVLIKQAIILPMIYLFFTGERPHVKDLVLTYAKGLFLSSFIAFFNDVIPNITDYIQYGYAYELEGEITRFSGLYSDPNYYSLALIMVLVGILLLYANKLLGNSTFVFYGIVAFLGAQTVSKSFFLMLIFLSILNIIVQIKSKKYLGAVAFSLIAIVAIAVVLVGDSSIFQTVKDRLLSGQDVTTGRGVLWGKYWMYLTENPLKLLVGSGVGVGYLLGGAPHNTYLDFLYYYGIFGTILFVFGMRFALSGVNGKKRKVSQFLPLLYAMIMYFFVSGLVHFDFVFILIYVFYIWNSDFLEKPKTRH